MQSIDQRVRAFWVILVTVSSASLLPACTKKPEETAKPMTQAQRDSAIAASSLPGASVVGKALEISDSAKARADEPIPEPRG